jgi:hypothetical protein
VQSCLAICSTAACLPCLSVCSTPTCLQPGVSKTRALRCATSVSVSVCLSGRSPQAGRPWLAPFGAPPPQRAAALSSTHAAPRPPAPAPSLSSWPVQARPDRQTAPGRLTCTHTDVPRSTCTHTDACMQCRRPLLQPRHLPLRVSDGRMGRQGGCKYSQGGTARDTFWRGVTWTTDR